MLTSKMYNIVGSCCTSGDTAKNVEAKFINLHNTETGFPVVASSCICNNCEVWTQSGLCALAHKNPIISIPLTDALLNALLLQFEPMSIPDDNRRKHVTKFLLKWVEKT